MIRKFRISSGPSPWIAVVVAAEILGMAFSAAEPSGTIRLRDTATINAKSSVCLGDIAELSGAAAALSEISITSAPPAGRVKNISATMVSSRLRQSGVDLQSLALEGADRVVLLGNANILALNRMAESLFDCLVSSMPWDPARTDIDIQPVQQSVYIPDGNISYEWQFPARWDFSGSATVRGTVLVNGRAEKQIPFRVTVIPHIQVAVASTDIPRGRQVSAADVTLQEIPLAERPADAITSPENVIGQVTRRTMLKGTVFTDRVLESQKIIRKNQIVPVEIAEGGIYLQTRARALADAKIGDRLLCANLSSQQQFEGIVQEDGRVIVTNP